VQDFIIFLFFPAEAQSRREKNLFAYLCATASLREIFFLIRRLKFHINEPNGFFQAAFKSATATDISGLF
jgi:hypothetical protein